MTSTKLKKMPVPKSGVSSYPKSSKVGGNLKKSLKPVATDFSLVTGSDNFFVVKTSSTKTAKAKRKRVERDNVGELVQVDRGSAGFTHPNSYSDTLSISDTYNGGKPLENLSEEQLLAIAHEALAGMRKSMYKHRSDYVHYGVVYTDGTYSLFPNQVCYGAMNCTYSIFDDKPIAFFLNYRQAKFASDNNIALTKWLLNDSPFADAFITKEVNQAIDQGQVLRTDKALAYVVSAMIAFRTCACNKGFVKNWTALKPHMPESIAFCLAHYFQFENAYYKFVPGGGWESLFARTLSKEAVLRFANNDLSLFDPTPAHINPFRYGDFTSVWKKKEEEELSFQGNSQIKNKVTWSLSEQMVSNVFLVSNIEEDCREFLRQIGWDNA